MSQEPDSDADLLKKVADGDELAFRALFDRIAPGAIEAARKVLGDSSSAEDVVQEVFVELWNDPARYDPNRGSVKAWIGTWSRNRAVDRARRDGAHERATQRASDRMDAIFEPISRADRTGLEDALAKLPDEQRNLLERMYYEGQTQVQIAEESGMSLGTVKSRIRLGMTKLREAFERRLPRFRGRGERDPRS